MAVFCANFGGRSLLCHPLIQAKRSPLFLGSTYNLCQVRESAILKLNEIFLFWCEVTLETPLFVHHYRKPVLEPG